MNNQNDTEARADRPHRSRWGWWLVGGLLVAAACVGVLYYIGWFNNRTHVDTPAGDNVTQTYAQPNGTEPGVNDWENPDHNSLREVIVDHADAPAPGTEAE